MGKNFAGKKVVVVGLARSGLSAALLLKKNGAEVKASDANFSPTIEANSLILKKSGITCELGGHTEAFLKGQDLVVASPGVCKDAPVLSWARKRKIPIISEIELGFLFCPAPIIAITGSNGKTTVTTLIGKILAAAGRKVSVCGNIGKPFCQEVGLLSKDHLVVLETSSFQLELIQRFRPKIALILNVSPNHLDRHKNFAEYFAAKKMIFRNQRATDYLVLNADDPNLSKIEGAKSKVIYFRELKNKNLGYLANPNAQAAICVAGLCAVEKKISEAALTQFKGVEHRLESVAEISGVDFINDSKSTSPAALLWALRWINQPVILLCGGRDKNADFCTVRQALQNKVKQVIVFGEAKEKIKTALNKSIAVSEAENIPQAVKRAFSLAHRGDCILLSPMCTSFDSFTCFEERGECFKKAVHDLRLKRQ